MTAGTPLQPLGDPNAVVCDGDSCVLPAADPVARPGAEPVTSSGPAASPR
jgi:hypothetical protein